MCWKAWITTLPESAHFLLQYNFRSATHSGTVSQDEMDAHLHESGSFSYGASWPDQRPLTW